MKTSKKILGATLALSLIIPLSGCGGSKYAVKGCKPTENFPCVPADENNGKKSIVFKDGHSYQNILGKNVTAGSKIIFSPKNFDSSGNIWISYMSLVDPKNIFGSQKGIVPIINGDELAGEDISDEFKISTNSDTILELPKEAIGKYVSFNISVSSGGKGEVKVTVE